MDLSAVLAAANPDSSKTADSKSQFGKDYNQFLKLLTTQLQYQDPLSPLETSEFTKSLVQFSNVEQQIRSNDYLQKLLTLNTTSLTGMALGYIGLNVYTPGEKFTFDGQHPAEVSYSMQPGAVSSNLSILDKDDNVIYTKTADNTPGQHSFTWDGNNSAGHAMPPGEYKVRIGAQDKEGKPLNVVTYTAGIVEGVETKEDGNVSVIINGKAVPVTDVRQAAIQKYVLQPPAAEETEDDTTTDTSNTPATDSGTDVAG